MIATSIFIPKNWILVAATDAETTPLGEDAGDHLGWNRAGQLLIQALGPEGQPLMIDAEEMQDRRIEIAHVDGIAHGVEAVVVGLPVGDSGLDPSPGHPGGEAAHVVVAAVVLAAES